ncbi:hypothetical protein Tco_0084523 [Tanacetum coccineum]
MNVFVRIGFGSTIELVSFDESQVVTFNIKFVCGFRNGDCGTGSRSDNTVGSLHGFVIHGIEILKDYEKVMEVIDFENFMIGSAVHTGKCAAYLRRKCSLHLIVGLDGKCSAQRGTKEWCVCVKNEIYRMREEWGNDLKSEMLVLIYWLNLGESAAQKKLVRKETFDGKYGALRQDPSLGWLGVPKETDFSYLMCGQSQMDLQGFQGVIDSGCSSKAFEYFNSKKQDCGRKLAYNGFSDSTPNVVGGTQSNGFAGTKASDNAGQARKETKPVKDYILLPFIGRKIMFNNANNVNAASTNEVNDVGGKTSIELPFDPNMHALEDYSIFDFSRNNEDDGAELT